MPKNQLQPRQIPAQLGHGIRRQRLAFWAAQWLKMFARLAQLDLEGANLKIPLILDEAVNIDEEGLLTHEFDELLHERPQSRLRHSWHQLVVQAALPEQGVDAPFGGACFEMFVEAQSFASGAKQRQKRNCQCIEKP